MLSIIMGNKVGDCIKSLLLGTQEKGDRRQTVDEFRHLDLNVMFSLQIVRHETPSYLSETGSEL